MSTNISLDMILANFDKRGVKYKFLKTKSDALRHNRNAAGANTNATPGGFGPLYGFVVHNFASDISDANSLNYLYSGDGPNSAKPGPLSQFGLDDSGTVWVIGWGTCTHTGPGDKETLDLVKRDAMPLDRDVIPDGSKDSGAVNPFFLAVEMLYGGKGPTAAQRAALIPFVAAVIEVLGKGYTGGSVAMHREFSTSRSDPTGFKGYEIRKAVNAQLAKWKSGTVTPPAPAQEDDLMAMTPAERAALIDDIKNAVWADVPWKGKEGIPASTARNNMGWQSSFGAESVSILRNLAPRVAAIEAVLAGDNDVEAFKAAAQEAFETALKSTLQVTVNPQGTV